tara:strand:+ start:18735 stop:19286 length:552 start_codon:yes stop_codon:yes gene_type:complete
MGIKKKKADPLKVITLANGLSLLRAFLAVPIVYFISIDNLKWTIITILFAVLTDFLDGILARSAGEVTDVGKMLDPVADKIVIISVILYLILDTERQFPLWFLILYLVRDIVISLNSIYILNHKSVVLSSNLIGKWSIGITSLAIFMYVLKYEIYGLYLLYAATILLILSWYQYIKTHLSFLK